MRWAVGIFGLLCGLVVTALVARYGFKTTDGLTDAYIAAFIYGAVTAGGLFLHTVAARLWPAHRPLAIGVGLVSVGALVLSLSNSLGAIAIRGESEAMKRIEHNRKVDAADAELKRLDGLRSGMESFVFTDAAAVETARQAGAVAASNRVAECDKRGPRCQAREVEEAAAANALMAATRNKALTDRARGLESAAEAERSKLKELGAKLEVNQQGTALARLLRLPETEADFASTAQQFGMAALVELIIIVCMMAWEALGRDQRAVEPARATAPEVQPLVRQPPRAPEPVAVEVLKPSEQRAFPKPEQPRLLVSNKRPVGSVALIISDVLEQGSGRVEFAEVFRAYRDECRAQGKDPVDIETFSAAVKRLCRETGVKTVAEWHHVYLIGVKIRRNEILAQKAVD